MLDKKIYYILPLDEGALSLDQEIVHWWILQIGLERSSPDSHLHT